MNISYFISTNTHVILQNDKITSITHIHDVDSAFPEIEQDSFYSAFSGMYLSCNSKKNLLYSEYFKVKKKIIVGVHFSKINVIPNKLNFYILLVNIIYQTAFSCSSQQVYNSKNDNVLSPRRAVCFNTLHFKK